MSFYYFGNKKLCAKHEKTREFHLYCWDHVCKVEQEIAKELFQWEYRRQEEEITRENVTFSKTKLSKFIKFRDKMFIIN